MMNRVALLGTLERATSKAASYAIRSGTPIAVAEKSILIGNTVVKKTPTNEYNIVTVNGDLLYKNISVFDVAIIVAQRYNSREMDVVKRVLQYDDRFSKYHTDMMHYLHCMKSAKKKNDSERFAILEDKFQTAEELAKRVRDGISVFKRVK